jgi:hypothetical protein
MKSIITALVLMSQTCWAQCDAWEPDFDRAIQHLTQWESAHSMSGASIVVGKVLRVDRKSPSSVLSEMEMQVESVEYGPFRGRTLKLTRGDRAEFFNFKGFKVGQRYKIVFYSEDEGNFVALCGAYVKRLSAQGL